jgi:hypothetical protein
VAHVKNRRHGKVHELPDDIRAEVNRLLIEPTVTYEDIQEFLKERGHDISSSSIGRYGQWFFNEVRETEMLRDQAALITSDPEQALLLEKLTATMITKRLAMAMQQDDFNVLKHAKLIDAFAKLQRSSTQREQWQTEVKNRVVKAAEAVSKIVEKNGLSDDAAAQIRAKILGVAK